MFSTELYALISEILVGSSTLTAICIFVWLLKGKNERFVDYFRQRSRNFLYGNSTSEDTKSTLEANLKKSDPRAWIPNTIVISKTDPLKEPDGKLGEAVLYPIVAALILGLGLAVEDAIDDAIDPHPITMAWIASTIQMVMGSKKAYRFAAIYQPIANELSEREWYSYGYIRACQHNAATSYRLTSLGSELLNTPKELFAAFIPPQEQLTSEDRQRWIRFLKRPDTFLFEDPFSMDPRGNINPSGAPGNIKWICARNNALSCEGQRELERERRCDLVIGVAQGIYYDANNWAKKSEPTVNVLRRWEIQVDTVGSLAAIASCIAIFILLWRLLITLSKILRLVTNPASTRGRMRLLINFVSRDRSEKLNSTRWWLAASLIVFAFCAYSYVIGLRGYTGRAMGMYASAHRRDDVGVIEVACKELEAFKDEIPLTPRCKVAAEEPSIKLREIIKILKDKPETRHESAESE